MARKKKLILYLTSYLFCSSIKLQKPQKPHTDCYLFFVVVFFCVLSNITWTERMSAEELGDLLVRKHFKYIFLSFFLDNCMLK